ncbi:MAG: outer membrane protein [Desulfovibrionaceae bacterium]
MKKHTLSMPIFLLLFFISFNTAHAANTFSTYTGLTLGYNYMMFGKSSATNIEGLVTTDPSFKYKSGSASAVSVGFVAGLTIPVLSNIAIRPAFEYSFTAPSSATFTAAKQDSSLLFQKFTANNNVHTLFANAYVDFYLTQSVYLYTGGGLGLSILNTQFRSPLRSRTSTATNFAWNAGVGVGYYITENVLIDLGVRYIDFGLSRNMSIPQGLPQDIVFSKIDFSDINVLLTLAYKF